MAQDGPTELEVLHGTGKGPALPEEMGEWVSVSPAHSAAADRLAQEVKDLLPGLNKQTQIRLLAALLDFHETR